MKNQTTKTQTFFAILIGLVWFITFLVFFIWQSYLAVLNDVILLLAAISAIFGIIKNRLTPIWISASLLNLMMFGWFSVNFLKVVPGSAGTLFIGMILSPLALTVLVAAIIMTSQKLGIGIEENLAKEDLEWEFPIAR